MSNLTVFNSAKNSTSFVLPINDFTSDYIVQIMFCILYGNIFILGVFGNVLVCYVVARNRRMHTVTNIFITNLALSDILLCFLAVPFTPLYTFLGGWIFGKTLCHLVPFAQGVSIYISTLTLTGIAADRFLVIVYPFHPRMKIQVCLWIIIGIWIVALVVTLPYGLYMQLEEPYTYCEEHWPNDNFRMIFSLMTTILQFVVPFFVITLCYACVSVKLNDRARLKPGSKTSKREEADRERKRRTNRMLIAMVTIFGISWLPLNIVNIVDDFYVSANDWSYYRLCFFITHCLAMSSTCYNPFLYAWLNDNFRKEFKQCIHPYSTQTSYSDWKVVVKNGRHFMNSLVSCRKVKPGRRYNETLTLCGHKNKGQSVIEVNQVPLSSVVLPCVSRGATACTPHTTEVCRSEKLYNGNETMQDSLLPNLTTRDTVVSGEIIILEPRAPVTSDQYAVGQFREATEVEDVTL